MLARGGEYPETLFPLQGEGVSGLLVRSSFVHISANVGAEVKRSGARGGGGGA